MVRHQHQHQHPLMAHLPPPATVAAFGRPTPPSLMAHLPPPPHGLLTCPPPPLWLHLASRHRA